MRVWTEEAEDSTGKAEWHGMVQRVVNGESHQFDNWQDLIDLLQEMLSGAGDGPKQTYG